MRVGRLGDRWPFCTTVAHFQRADGASGSGGEGNGVDMDLHRAGDESLQGHLDGQLDLLHPLGKTRPQVPHP